MKNYSVSEFTHEALDNVTSEFIADLTESFINKKVTNRAFGIFTSYGPGTITGINGATLANLMFTITFDSGIIKEYSAKVACFQTKALTFVDEADYQLFNDYCEAYTEIEQAETELNNSDIISRLEAHNAAKQAVKEAEAAKKAEKAFEAKKQKACQEFEDMSKNTKTTLNPTSEFFYALGWLASHASTVSASLPDYLANAFAKHFGSETPCHVVDSKKKGPAGYTSQWSWSFAASLKKYDNIPCCLVQYLNPTGKSITDTSFLWDIIDHYGFQFGKKQNVDQIKSNIPNDYLSDFEEGFVA